MDFLRFLGSLTAPFFRWWWALITGVATLLSYFAWETTGLTLSSAQVAMAVLSLFALGFLLLSVLTQGFKWYLQAHQSPHVLSCSPSEGDAEDEVFHLRSLLPLQPGQVISLLRTIEGRVVCMGMLKVERLVSDSYQCIPLWLGAGHRQDLRRGRIQPRHLSASLLLNESDLSGYLREATER